MLFMIKFAKNINAYTLYSVKHPSNLNFPTQRRHIVLVSMRTLIFALHKVCEILKVYLNIIFNCRLQCLPTTFFAQL